MASSARPLAVVTGASTGIGYELAKCCARGGFDLVVAADEPAIVSAAADFQALGARVDAVEADLATLAGVDKLYEALKGRPVDALLIIVACRALLAVRAAKVVRAVGMASPVVAAAAF